MWTSFMDIHSGGLVKLDNFEYIYIEASEDEARAILYNRFGINAARISCSCCGEDYHVQQYTDLFQATAFERGCAYDNKTDQYIEVARKSTNYTYPYMTLDEYLISAKVLVIYADDIQKSECTADIPKSGWIWL